MKNLWVLFYRRWRKVTAFFAKGWLDQPSQTSTQVCENCGFQTQESSCLNSALNEMIYYSFKWKPSEIPFLLCLRKTACFQTSYIKQRPLSADSAQSPRHPPSVFLHLCESRRQSCGGPRKLRLPSGGGRSPSGLAVLLCLPWRRKQCPPVATDGSVFSAAICTHSLSCFWMRLFWSRNKGVNSVHTFQICSLSVHFNSFFLPNLISSSPCSSQIKVRAACPGGDCRLLDLSIGLVSPRPGSSVDAERVCDRGSACEHPGVATPQGPGAGLVLHSLAAALVCQWGDVRSLTLLSSLSEMHFDSEQKPNV